MKKLLASLLLSLLVLTTSCATIINGSRDRVTVKANPANAKIYVDGEFAGLGNTEVKLRRGKEHVVEVKLDGYRSSRVTTDNSITGWFWGNLLLGIFPAVLDLVTGSAYDVDPDIIVVTLDSGTGSIDVPAGPSLGTIEARTETGEMIAHLAVTWE